MKLIIIFKDFSFITTDKPNLYGNYFDEWTDWLTYASNQESIMFLSFHFILVTYYFLTVVACNMAEVKEIKINWNRNNSDYICIQNIQNVIL